MERETLEKNQTVYFLIQGEWKRGKLVSWNNHTVHLQTHYVRRVLVVKKFFGLVYERYYTNESKTKKYTMPREIAENDILSVSEYRKYIPAKQAWYNLALSYAS